MKNKNTKQIIPYIILVIPLLLFFAVFSAPFVLGTSRTSSIGSNPKNAGAEGTDEELDLNVCGLSEVICQEIGESATAGKHGGGAFPPAAGSPLSEQIKILKDICKNYGDYCWKDLWAICLKEGCRKEAIGDQGRSYGYYQIQIRLHKITKECAQDLRCAAQWTLSNLIRNGYPKYRSYAIIRHNGWGAQAITYAIKVKQIAEQL